MFFRVTVLTSFLLLGATNPVWAEPPRVFAPGVISGPLHDTAPAFTPDGRTVYFSQQNEKRAVIVVSHRIGKAGWSKPELAPFSAEWNDLEPAFSPDGKFLVFSSNRPAKSGGSVLDGSWDQKPHPQVGGNLWKVERQGDGWGAPVRLPEVINRSNSIFAPAVVRDGSIYFMDPDPKTGRFHQWRSQLKDGVYQPAEPLPFSAPPADADCDIAVAPDESFAVFSSSRAPTTPHNIDLFLVRKKDGKWGVPRHLGFEVNSPDSDAESRLGPDGHTLYFSSNRSQPLQFPSSREAMTKRLAEMNSWDNGYYNIYEMDLAPWLKE